MCVLRILPVSLYTVDGCAYDLGYQDGSSVLGTQDASCNGFHCCGNGSNPVPARAVTQLVPAGLHLRFRYLYRVDVQIQFVSGGVTEDDKYQK